MGRCRADFQGDGAAGPSVPISRRTDPALRRPGWPDPDRPVGDPDQSVITFAARPISRTIESMSATLPTAGVTP